MYCTTPRHAASAVRIKTRQTGQYLAREQQQPAATIHYVYLIKSDLQLAGLGGAGRYATGQAFIQTVSSLTSPVTSFVLWTATS